MYRCSTYVEIITASGTVKFDYVHSLTVQHSVESLTDTCSIVLPRNLNLKDKNIRDIIQVGDRVKVQLGYVGDNETVFEGYVRRIKPGTPVELTCEDDMYVLKKIKVENEHYPSLMLEDFLKLYLPAGTEMRVGSVNLGEQRFKDEPTLARVLDTFSSNSGINFFYRDRVFYGVMVYSYTSLEGVNTHKLKLSWNTLDGYRLNYLTADDLELTIKAFVILKNNEKIEVSEGTGEEIRTYHSDSATTKEELTVFAKNLHKHYTEERIEGSLTIFGKPLIKVADRITLLSDRDAEFNNKTFLVKEVKRIFDDNGIKQQITLGGAI